MSVIPITRDIWHPDRALRFPSGITGYVDHGAAFDTIVKNNTIGSCGLWIRQSSFAAAQTLVRTFDVGATGVFIFSLTAAGIQLTVGRGTQSQNVTCTFAQLGNFNSRPGEWRFIAGQWDLTAGNNSNQKIFAGSLTEPITEASGYSPQRAGSGTVAVTANSLVGNSLIAAQPLDGNIAVIMAYTRFLQPAEWQAAMEGNPPRDSMILYSFYGDEAASTASGAVRDISGTGNNGTIGGSGVVLDIGPALVARHLYPFAKSYLAAAAAVALRRNSSLSGLGSSGPFFHDPLAS